MGGLYRRWCSQPQTTTNASLVDQVQSPSLSFFFSANLFSPRIHHPTVDLPSLVTWFNHSYLPFSSPITSHLLSSLPETIDEIATVISRSVGPSGANSEYLFNLCQKFKDMELVDSHLRDLEAAVRAKMLLKV